MFGRPEKSMVLRLIVETTNNEFYVYSDGNAFLTSTYDEYQQIHLSSFLIYPMSFQRNGHLNARL